MPDAIILGSDHAGFELKEKLKESLDRRGVPYETWARGRGVRRLPGLRPPGGRGRARRADARGILVCGSGLGMSMAANRHPGVRAALAYDEETARARREHNDANVLALGARSLDHALAERILEVWLETPFEGGRHAGRVAKIDPKTSAE